MSRNPRVLRPGPADRLATTSEPVGTRELHWIRPHLVERHYMLLDGNDVRLHLRFDSFFGGSATLTDDHGQAWTLERSGALWHSITVRRPGSPEDGTVLRTGWRGGGEIAFGTRRFTLSSSLLWQRTWWWRDGSGEEIVRVDVDGFTGTQARVQLSDSARSVPELPLLLGLGWQAITLALRATSGGAGPTAT